MRHAFTKTVAITAASACMFLAAGCENDDEFTTVDGGTIQYVPVAAIESTTYRGGTGYNARSGHNGLRQLDREYLRYASPGAAGGVSTSAGYSIQTQGGSGRERAFAAGAPAGRKLGTGIAKKTKGPIKL